MKPEPKRTTLQAATSPPAPSPGELLTPQELAARLKVPATWLKEKTRQRARLRDSDPLPRVKLGKYVRFDWQAVQAWMVRQQNT